MKGPCDEMLDGILGRTCNKPIAGVEYHVTATLYSSDGKRSVEIREFSHGDTYLLESEWDKETFRERHDGSLVGPFVSPKRAEKFIISTNWFRGQNSPKS